MMEGLEPRWDHVCSFTGLRVSRPLESIQLWKEGAHDEAVECGRDHLGEWVLKSPKNRVGMLSSRIWEKIWVRACPKSGLS